MKARFDLIPPLALRRVAEVMAAGDLKHPGDDWREQPDSVHFAAAQRHQWDAWAGEEVDGENRADLLAHAACRVLFQLELAILDERKEG